MNQIRREDRNAKLIQDISAVVERHGWPDFIDGFQVKLGEFEGEPAVWVIYQIKSGVPLPRATWEERADRLNELQRAVRLDLLDVDEDRLSIFHFADPVA